MCFFSIFFLSMTVVRMPLLDMVSCFGLETQPYLRNSSLDAHFRYGTSAFASRFYLVVHAVINLGKWIFLSLTFSLQNRSSTVSVASSSNKRSGPIPHPPPNCSPYRLEASITVHTDTTLFSSFLVSVRLITFILDSS